MVIGGKSIVTRSAFYGALLSAAVSAIVFFALFQVQRSIYERRLVKDAEESIRRLSQTFLGYFYAQGNWVYLEDQQRVFNKTQNVLYNYIANASGVIEIGLDGMQSADVGTMKLPWEPPIPHSDEENGIKIYFNADQVLADRFPGRIELGDKLVLISSPIRCLTTKETCGHLRTAVIFEGIADTLTQLRITLLVCGVLLAALTALLISITLKRFLTPLSQISARMRQVANDIASGINPPLQEITSPLAKGHWRREVDETTETKVFRESLEQFTSAFQKTANLESELRIMRSLSDLAAQVAHDIRSPLAALEVFSNNLSELPEERRIMLRSAATRIRDIANNLINDYQPTRRSEVTQENGEIAGTEVVCLLASLVDDLLSEKRIEFRSRIEVSIDGSVGEQAYGIFIRVEPATLKRVLSNVINNAVESIDRKGHVQLGITSANGMAVIQITDSGRGIPENVMPRLMEKGFSYNKEGGVGLGLYFAKENIEKWGGSISLESSRSGTSVTLRIPRSEPPSWYVPCIGVKNNQTIVVADDDSSIHQVWNGRLTRVPNFIGNVVHVSSPGALKDYVLQNQPLANTALFLVDYEFIGYAETGIDVIRNLGIAKQSILVTSRFEEPSLLAQCRDIQLRLIPKGQAGFVPIQLKSQSMESPAAVLIDDDILVQEAWKAAFQNKGKLLRSFSFSKDFFAIASELPKQTPIFIDSSLGEERPGELIAVDIQALGFTEIYLATGYPASYFGELPAIRKVVSKEVPKWIIDQ